MRVSPMVLVRALVSRLSADERMTLVGELLDGAAAAARPIRSAVMPSVQSAEE